MVNLGPTGIFKLLVVTMTGTRTGARCAELPTRPSSSNAVTWESSQQT